MRYVNAQSRYGVAERHGSVTVSPGINGEARFEHNLWAKPSFALVNVYGNTSVYAHVVSYDKQDIVVKLTNLSGRAVASGFYEIHWLAKT